MRPIRIFTPVWGSKYIEWFEKALCGSLLWPKNFEVIKHAKWSILCHHSEFHQVAEIASKVLPPEQIETMEVNGPMEDLNRWKGIRMNEGVVSAMKKCVDQDSLFLMATTDFIYGDGTLANMIKEASVRRSCISMAHFRVHPTILPELNAPLSNYELVSLSRKHPHMSWTESEWLKNPSGSPVGGITWRDEGNGIHSVRHRMPSPYLCNITQEDVNFMATQNDEKMAAFGAFDHDWPAELIKQERFRLILSSDQAFMGEVTSPGDNCPTLRVVNPNEPDAFWHDHDEHNRLHHQMNRQFISCFRGAP